MKKITMSLWTFTHSVCVCWKCLPLNILTVNAPIQLKFTRKSLRGIFPKAFHQIECAEARRFVGKCLENVSSRPSAKKLLMEPFLLLEENDQLIPILKSPPQNPTPNQKKPKIVPSLAVHDQEKNIDMTITGSMNPEDGEIFLKVFISDKFGKARNIHFPFDVASDTGLDVATEMVKELDIKDWEPFDIAEMIDKEIVYLIPTWNKYHLELIQNLNHHNFDYDEDDDDDNNIPHPFHSPSSQSSSQVSPEVYFPLLTQYRINQTVSQGLRPLIGLEVISKMTMMQVVKSH